MSKLAEFLRIQKRNTQPRDMDALRSRPAEEEWSETVSVDVEVAPVTVRKTDAASEDEEEEIDLPLASVRGGFDWKKDAGKKDSATAPAEAAASAPPPPVITLPGTGRSGLGSKGRKEIREEDLPSLADSAKQALTAPKKTASIPDPQAVAKPIKRRMAWGKALERTAGESAEGGEDSAPGSQPPPASQETATTAAVVVTPPAPVPVAKPKKVRAVRVKREFALSAGETGVNKHKCLSSRDLWGVVNPWNSGEHQWPYKPAVIQ